MTSTRKWVRGAASGPEDNVNPKGVAPREAAQREISLLRRLDVHPHTEWTSRASPPRVADCLVLSRRSVPAGGGGVCVPPMGPPDAWRLTGVVQRGRLARQSWQAGRAQGCRPKRSLQAPPQHTRRLDAFLSPTRVATKCDAIVEAALSARSRRAQTPLALLLAADQA